MVGVLFIFIIAFAINNSIKKKRGQDPFAQEIVYITFETTQEVKTAINNIAMSDNRTEAYVIDQILREHLNNTHKVITKRGNMNNDKRNY